MADSWVASWDLIKVATTVRDWVAHLASTTVETMAGSLVEMKVVMKVASTAASWDSRWAANSAGEMAGQKASNSAAHWVAKTDAHSVDYSDECLAWRSAELKAAH